MFNTLDVAAPTVLEEFLNNWLLLIIIVLLIGGVLVAIFLSNKEKKKMKSKYLLLLLLCLPILIVNADMGAPMIPSYKAIVNNPNGITIEGKKIAYGTEVKVDYEMYLKNSYQCYVEDYGETPCSNLVPIDKEFNLNDALKTKRVVKIDKTEIVVLNEKGVDLYKGPSVIYEKIGTVAANTKFNTEYVSGDGMASDTTPIRNAIWLYIDNGSTKGWIYALDKNVGYKPSTKEVFVPTDVTIVDDNQKELFRIPANTLVKVLYDTDAWSFHFLIEYKGQKGFISTYDVAYKSSGTVKINNNMNLLKTANNENIGVIEKLEKGNTYTFIYAMGEWGESWYYITTPNGNKGWIYSDGEKEDYWTVTFNTTTTEEETIEEEEETVLPKEEEPTTTNAKKEYGMENEITKYILIGAVVVLSAIVVLLLINRKNNERV